MSNKTKWKWSLNEAFSIIKSTYIDDWGKGVRDREAFLSKPHISEIKQGNIRGLSVGDKNGEGQPVIFIHGSPANAMRWAWYLDNVPDGYQFISIDRMGFGARGAEKPNLEEDIKKLTHFLYDFENPILVGHSLGGATAIRLASILKIKGLVLIGASIDPALEKHLYVQAVANEPIVSWMLSRSVRHSNLEMAQLKNFMLESEKHLKQITAPVHVVHAKDDALVSFGNVAYVDRNFVNAAHVQLTAPETGGHALPWFQSKVIMDAICSFDKKEAA